MFNVIMIQDGESRNVILKIRSLIHSAKICMVTNNIFEWPLNHQPLSNQWMDNDGAIWFINIQADPNIISNKSKMDVFYANAEKAEFLSLTGLGSFASEEEIPSEIWRSHGRLAREGSIQAVKFSPEEAYCWNDECKDMVQMDLGSSRIFLR